jgi:hypothetical protein
MRELTRREGARVSLNFAGSDQARRTTLGGGASAPGSSRSDGDLGMASITSMPRL